ncbi:MAG: asparagine synthase (glutamine-hydrolyzing) [Candidatus Jorgensenbacteria bacterium]
MCGITGIYHFNNSKTVDERTLVVMRDTLTHRGPDDAGIYISPDGRVGFGTRRLKIIDLSDAAHMPMGTENQKSILRQAQDCPERSRGTKIKNQNGKVWITYNGEIYNFRELRSELEKKGYAFKSRSDTEIILKCYLEYGVDCVKRFNGMFAFAISDERTGTLFAARDHLGVKPFYYTVQNGTFYFGSEIKAILAHPDFRKELAEEVIPHYLAFSTTPAPLTLFRDIKKLPAARALTVGRDGVVREWEYWNPSINSGQAPLSEQGYIEQVRMLLRNSIRGQMVSDVPFGCFLSGGIDSSVNAALMSEVLGKPVETFSVGMKGMADRNEFEYSRAVARKLGAHSHEIEVDESHLTRFLADYAFHFDDPNGDPVSFPLFWLSKLTKDAGVTVIQIGEGSDELFAGYEQYIRAKHLYERWWKKLAALPAPLRRAALLAIAPFRGNRAEFAREYLRRLAAGEEPFWGTAVAFSELQKTRLLDPSFAARIAPITSYPFVERFYSEVDREAPDADFLARAAYLEVKHRLPEFLLARADRMTMAHSVEGRVPFLDHRLVELALAMPSEIKTKGNVTKYILKKAVAGIIPDEIINRKKQGFGSPIGAWLRNTEGAGKTLADIISHSKLKERGFLNYDYANSLLAAHQRGASDESFRLWNLITLSLWYDHWFS